MTKNPRRSLVAVATFAAVSLAGCSLATGATPVQTPPGSPATAASTAPAVPVTAPAVTVTVTPPPPPATVTVTPPPAPAPTPATQYTGTGAFQSPSGNIDCALFSYGGQNTVQCEVAEHSWVAPPQDPECHLNWGSRLSFVQGSEPVFTCYGQGLPAPERTLGYGQTWSLGSITCYSESVGMTCTDSSTGHYFFVARETYQLR